MCEHCRIEVTACICPPRGMPWNQTAGYALTLEFAVPPAGAAELPAGAAMLVADLTAALPMDWHLFTSGADLMRATVGRLLERGPLPSLSPAEVVP